MLSIYRYPNVKYKDGSSKDNIISRESIKDKKDKEVKEVKG
jgi:hypothetical protein